MQSDCIFVIDPGGYVGESTQNEMRFAELLNKPVYRFSDNELMNFKPPLA